MPHCMTSHSVELLNGYNHAFVHEVNARRKRHTMLTTEHVGTIPQVLGEDSIASLLQC